MLLRALRVTDREHQLMQRTKESMAQSAVTGKESMASPDAGKTSERLALPTSAPTIAARFVDSAPISFYHNSKPITLPPTPEDLQLVEVMLNDLSGLRKSTDEIMLIVSQHVFGGLPREVAMALSGHITEAAALCRRCSHCVLRCNPRAVVVVEGAEGRDLALEVKNATSHFDQVASAARSVLRQVPRPGVVDPRSRAPPSGSRTHPVQRSDEVADAWSELFELPTGTKAPAPATAPSQPPLLELTDTDGTDADAADSASDAPRTPAQPATETPQQTPVRAPSPASPSLSDTAPLSLWRAREHADAILAEYAFPGTPSTGRAPGGEQTGAFDELASHNATPGPHAPTPTTPRVQMVLTPAHLRSGVGSASQVRPPGVDVLREYAVEPPQLGAIDGGATPASSSESIRRGSHGSIPMQGPPPEASPAQMLQQIQVQMQIPVEATRSQEQQQAIGVNEELIAHKQATLREVAAEVHALNELFIELGHFVALQGEGVEHASYQAEETHHNVLQARRQLEQAEADQNKCVIS